MSFADIIDEWRPYNGPCGLCGYWDQRHRMIECIRGRIKAGDKIKDLAEEYKPSGVNKRIIKAMMHCRIDRRRYKEIIDEKISQRH